MDFMKTNLTIRFAAANKQKGKKKKGSDSDDSESSEESD